MQFLFEPWNDRRLQEIIGHLKSLTSKKMVTIQDPKRSLQQNNTYWQNVEILCKHSGYTKEEMNSIIKHSLTETGKLKMIQYVTTKKGKTYPVETSSADLDTKEFSILMEYIFGLGKALKLNMAIPGEIDTVQLAKEIF